jgi:glycosyltransferase involved in cell wall biosynthesis
MAQRKTLLHVIDTGGPGGAETIFLNLVTGLDSSRWSSIAVLPVRDWLWETLEAHGVTPVHLPSDGAFDVGYLSRLTRVAKQSQADLIQTHLFSSAVYGTMAARWLGLPVVCTHHGQTDVVSSGSYRGIKSRIVRRKQNRHVFVSRGLQRSFERSKVVDRKHAHVIHNGIDCNLFQPARSDEVRAQLGVRPDEILIGAVGNMRAPKDYPTFLRAAAALAARSPRYRFMIAGAADDPIRTELKALEQELGLSDRLIVAGFRSDIERVMNALDIYVLSSASEGFSLTTVQAMACGLPVVATRCGGPEEIVVPGETGYLVPTASPADLAEAVDVLAMDDERRSLFGRAGRARALREFSIDSMIGGYAQLYEECVGAA